MSAYDCSLCLFGYFRPYYLFSVSPHRSILKSLLYLWRYIGINVHWLCILIDLISGDQFNLAFCVPHKYSFRNSSVSPQNQNLESI